MTRPRSTSTFSVSLAACVLTLGIISFALVFSVAYSLPSVIRFRHSRAAVVITLLLICLCTDVFEGGWGVAVALLIMLVLVMDRLEQNIIVPEGFTSSRSLPITRDTENDDVNGDDGGDDDSEHDDGGDDDSGDDDGGDDDGEDDDGGDDDGGDDNGGDDGGEDDGEDDGDDTNYEVPLTKNGGQLSFSGVETFDSAKNKNALDQVKQRIQDRQKSFSTQMSQLNTEIKDLEQFYSNLRKG